MGQRQTDFPTLEAPHTVAGVRADSGACFELAECLDELFLAFDAAGRCCGWNHLSAAAFGRLQAEALGRRFDEVVPMAELRAVVGHVRQALRHRRVERFDHTLRGPESTRVLEVRLVPARAQLLVFARDVTHARCELAALESLATTRETALRAQQHRLKNDLQMVNALLHRQLRHLACAEVSSLLAETQERIRAMALVHDLLAHAGSVDTVDASVWISHVARSLCEAHPADRRPVLCVAAATITLSAPTANRLGCLLAELVSNALWHAWPDGAFGTLEVSLARTDDSLELVVEDDGIGLPDEPAARRPARLGLCLAAQFARQLGAKLELSSPRGTRIRAVFAPCRPA